jgi:hypothetical protein
MDGKRVIELLRLDQELATTDLLWRYTPSERLYLLEWRARLIKTIERVRELDQDDCSLLLIDGDSCRNR